MKLAVPMVVVAILSGQTIVNTKEWTAAEDQGKQLFGHVDNSSAAALQPVPVEQAFLPRHSCLLLPSEPAPP